MIARLRGILEEKSKERVVVDVNGVGYGLSVPETVLLRLPETGQSVVFEVYTLVREDQLTLFGFSSRLEKDVFELLMSASGVGPKVALSVLSSLEAIQILEGVSQGNKALFSGISGVGKKTVEKLLIEIREKAEKRLLLERGTLSEASGKRTIKEGTATGGQSWINDLEQALLALGYRENDVKTAVRELLSRGQEVEGFDAALRSALQYLSGGLNKGVRGNA
jgi:Holliday junction DNA helicase RuvA